MLDAGVLDSGVLDAGVLESGVLDAGVLDPGVLDTGVLDAGVLDASVLDAGVLDVLGRGGGIKGPIETAGSFTQSGGTEVGPPATKVTAVHWRGCKYQATLSPPAVGFLRMG
ncbi:hypothetical protein B0T26DRAFT_717084 [Lasiosphaeria miniovina]|uniref:Uncharacterized protein n=1 Tax=Lasiosphaeria miniovina TaxID=1954250 RepID=A0AA40ACF1_9PEZI|nr:uncharacterized protein B0T26DRAFT_717084 [Lasiosphaeria miniovina]KAK0713318.1 hypothetical protein B0T26DRAFT_717084 [Lasiosphaeria miniovina]